MTTAKLFERLNMLLESQAEADKKHIKKLHEVLKKLKKKQKLLNIELEEAGGEHRKRKIKQEIEVIKVQRRKGVDVYKELKRARAEAKSERDAAEEARSGI